MLHVLVCLFDEHTYLCTHVGEPCVQIYNITCTHDCCLLLAVCTIVCRGQTHAETGLLEAVYPRIEQRLCQEVSTPADKFSLEIPAANPSLRLVPCASHYVTPCLLLVPAVWK